MAKPVLVVNNITKHFKRRIAVNEVSFSINEGEIFGLIGPNGAGKTTAIRMITGLAKIDKGSVLINGFNVSTQFESAIKKVGGIIEEPKMYGYLSGMTNIKIFASLYGKLEMPRIMELVNTVQLQNRIHNKVKTYSLGMKQRLGIAQSLVHRPNLLILDEPLNGLDPTGIIEMRNFLKDIAKKEKIAMLISSHILSEVELLCDKVGIINNGYLIENKEIKELQRGIASQHKYAVKVSHPNFAGKAIIGKFAIEDVRIIGSSVIFPASREKLQEILRFLISRNISIFGTSEMTKSLEEIYQEMVASKNKAGIL